MMAKVRRRLVSGAYDTGWETVQAQLLPRVANKGPPAHKHRRPQKRKSGNFTGKHETAPLPEILTSLHESGRAYPSVQHAAIRADCSHAQATPHSSLAVGHGRL